MNGAQSLVQTLVNCGVDTCFANPGTSEMHLVAALDTVKGLRPVLCLFEGVATGAADGYGRVAGKPAATLLHLGPGLANGLANLHNARRAATPIVNIVGDHATYHLQYDALLTSDIVGFARPVSSWIHETKSAKLAASDAARAVQAARAAPGGIATLILSADAAWNPAERAAQAIAGYRSREGERGYDRRRRQTDVKRQEDGDAAARPRAGRRRAGGGRAHSCQDRRAAVMRHLCAACRDGRRPRAGGADSVFRRAGHGVSCGNGANDHGWQQAAGVVLCLSGQTELVRARGLRADLSRPSA